MDQEDNRECQVRSWEMRLDRDRLEMIMPGM